MLLSTKFNPASKKVRFTQPLRIQSSTWARPDTEVRNACPVHQKSNLQNYLRPFKVSTGSRPEPAVGGATLTTCMFKFLAMSKQIHTLSKPHAQPPARGEDRGKWRGKIRTPAFKLFKFLFHFFASPASDH